jgi:hypothetical protein
MSIVLAIKLRMKKPMKIPEAVLSLSENFFERK